jgi:hypothetical protein
MLYTFGTAMEKRIQSEPLFEHELMRRTPQLVKSTCDRCGAFQLGSYEDGSLDTWEREHDCEKTVARLTLFSRLRSWLAM